MKISILGTGVYGLAMANLILLSGYEVTMWTERDPKEVIVKSGITVTNSFEDVSDKDIIFVLTGSKFVRSVLEGIKSYVPSSSLIVLGSKGILDDGVLMTDIVEEVLPDNRYAVISGPTFAVDIANLEPVGFTIGAENVEDFEKLQRCLNRAYIEYSTGILAIEMAGSLKNAYAIGSGIINGLNFGHSTTCLYLTRAFSEMSTIFEKMGTKKEYSSTLAGIGDLVLTCTSSNSRNYTFGTILAIGTKEERENYLEVNTVEGYENLKSYVKLFKKKNIDAPLIFCIDDIVSGKKEPEHLIELLLH